MAKQCAYRGLDLRNSFRSRKAEHIELDQQDVYGNRVFQDSTDHGVLGTLDIQLQEGEVTVSILAQDFPQSPGRDLYVGIRALKISDAVRYMTAITRYEEFHR